MLLLKSINLRDVYDSIEFPILVLFATLIPVGNVMTLSYVINNATERTLMKLAQGLGSNPGAFLIAVALAASSAFLIPSSHQSHAPVMGPGGSPFSVTPGDCVGRVCPRLLRGALSSGGGGPQGVSSPFRKSRV